LPGREPRYPLLLLALAAVAFLLQGFAFPDCLSDDAFISFRYADNLGGGHGLVFNPGEPPVEGYTNFLWTLLMAGGMALGLDPEPTSRRLGVAFALLALACSYQAIRRILPGQPLLWALPAWLLAADSFFVVEAIQGLETVMFAAFLTAAAASVPEDLPAPGGAPGEVKRFPISGLWFALAALTRPEGWMLFLVVAGLRGLELLRFRQVPGRPDRLWAALFAMPVAAHLVFRRSFYGDWLPNTFFAKTGGGGEQVLRGMAYLGSGLARMAPWLALGALVLWLQRGAGHRKQRRAALVLTSLWLVSSAGVVVVGGDFKPTFRFLVWTFPLLAVLATAGIGGLARRVDAAHRRPGTVLVVALIATALLWAVAGSAPARRFAGIRRHDLRNLRQAAGWFTEHLPHDAVLATGPAGAIPYYTGLKTIDMWGINDREIGRRRITGMGSGPAGHEKGDGGLVLGRRPDVILFTEARFSPVPVPERAVALGYLYVSERELLGLTEFHRLYRWRSVRLPDRFMNFYQRKDGEGMGT
jgi:hypothetical protein